MFLMDPHNVHHVLYKAPKIMADPGDGGTIRVDEDLQILEMVSAAAETRTLANPDREGVRFTLRMLTDGGDIVVTAANGLNVTGNTVATFDATSELLSLVSVEYASGYRWDILHNIGSVGLS